MRREKKMEAESAAATLQAPKFKLLGTDPIFIKRSERRVRLLSNLFVFSLLNFMAPPPRPHPTAPLIIRLPVKHGNRTEGEERTFIIPGALPFSYLQITAKFREQKRLPRASNAFFFFPPPRQPATRPPPARIRSTFNLGTMRSVQCEPRFRPRAVAKYTSQKYK